MVVGIANLCARSAVAQISPVSDQTDSNDNGDVITAAATVASAEAPGDEIADPSVPQLGPPATIRFRVGAEITASRGACKNILAMVTVPLECPEQQVKIIEEDFSPDVEVSYRMLQGGANQMLIAIRFLQNGTSAHAYLTTEVSIHPVLPPTDTKTLKIPSRLRGPLRMYTNGSPYIETKHRTIRTLAKDILKELDESASDWEKVEAIYDHVLEAVKYVEGPDKSALDALRDEQADCQGRSALFIALCRANEIPARMVWVDGHAYPEFYLEHAEGEGRWYPCESAGTRAFGEMPLARVILQKGDNFRVPERKEKLRYASDFVIGVPVRGGGRPKVKYVRQQLN